MGDYFGHEEIINGNEKRQTRVKCLTDVKIIYINKADFLKTFWKHTLENMKERHCHLIDLEYIVSHINKYYIMCKSQNKAMLDATKINPHNLHCGDRKVNGVGDSGLQTENKVAKLRPWLVNANNNKTQSKVILRELKRVKVLDVRKEKWTVKRANLTTAREIKEFEELLKPRAKFITYIVN